MVKIGNVWKCKMQNYVYRVSFNDVRRDVCKRAGHLECLYAPVAAQLTHTLLLVPFPLDMKNADSYPNSSSWWKNKKATVTRLHDL